MQSILLTIQLGVAGFVAWGGWLCFSARARQLLGDGANATGGAPASADSFERVASLVLLALLCTTIAALG